MASIHGAVREHDAHAGAGHDRAAQRSKRGKFHYHVLADDRLHVRPIPFAKWQSDSELRVKGGELVQALELVIAAGSGANINRNPKLMV
jgi:hypothetical protein